MEWQRQHRCVWALLSLLVIGGARAAESSRPLRLDLDLFGQYQTNVTARPVDPQHGMLYRVGLNANGSGQGKYYDWDVNGNFGYEDYRPQLLDDSYNGRGTANARWFMRGDNLEWDFNYLQSQQVINPASAAIGNNLTTLQVFGSGPTLRLNITDMDQTSLSARRQLIQRGSDQYYRNWYSAGFRRTIRPGQQVYTNADYKVTQLGYGVPDYYNREVVAGYSYTGPRGQLILEGGRSWLEQEGGSPRLTSRTGMATAKWSVAEKRHIEFKARQTLSDEATDLQSLAVANQLSLGLQGIGAFRVRDMSLSYIGSVKTFDPAITMWGRQTRYLLNAGSLLNTDERGGRALMRIYNADTSYVTVAFLQTHRVFVDSDRVDDDRQAQLEITRLLTSSFSVTAGAGWFYRNSTQSSAEYKNLTANLELKARLR